MENIRAEVVGSLVRPGYLAEARQDRRDGALSTARFKQVEDRAVQQAIALQEGVGLDVVTDGEFRRGIFTGPLEEAVDGLEYVPGVLRTWYCEDGPVEEEIPQVVTGKLGHRRSVVLEEFAYARAIARLPLKVTVPSPLMMFLRWSPEHSTGAYSDAFAMAADAAAIVRRQIQDLADLGCTYVQVDAPELATLVQPETREWYESQGISTYAMLTEGIDLLSEVTTVPGITYAIHLCRGNRAGRWMASGGYDFIAEALFQRATGFDRYLLEYDDPRSGSFEPLRQVPEEATVVLGLVSTKRPELESVDALAGRVDAAAAHLPKDRLAISTQCGFASAAGGNPGITWEVQEAKLRLVTETARIAF
ncbi:MAG: methionine synthase [Streptosporangiales bacterium]|nr:methionine synthase [Streptosporangiales bacterium]